MRFVLPILLLCMPLAACSDDGGSSTGTDTGSETGEETGDETGDETGEETGDETGEETGEETGDETGDETSDDTADEPDVVDDPVEDADDTGDDPVDAGPELDEGPPPEDVPDDPQDGDDGPVEDVDDPSDAADDPDGTLMDAIDDVGEPDDAGGDGPEVDDTGGDDDVDEGDVDEGEPGWWEVAETDGPVSCDELPSLPLDYGLVSGFGGSEDFAFDAHGNMIFRQGSHVVRKNMAGDTEVIIPNVGFTAGIGVRPNGDIVVAMESTLVVAFAGGGYHPILAGLQYPNGLDVDENGFIFVAEQTGGRLRKVDGDTGDFEVLAEGLNNPNGVSFGPGYDRVYVGSFGGGTVHALDKNPDGTWTEPWLFAEIDADELFAGPPPETIPPIPTGYAPCDGVADGGECIDDDGWAGTCSAGDCEKLPDAVEPAVAACQVPGSDHGCSVQYHGVELPGDCVSGGGAAVCCDAQPGTGCISQPCEDCVCPQDPFCCDTQWDDLCAGAANNACSDVCLCDLPPSEEDEVKCYVKPDPLLYCEGKSVGDICNFITFEGEIIGASCHELGGMELGGVYPESGLGCVTPEDLGSWIDPQPFDYLPCEGLEEGAECLNEGGELGACTADGDCEVDGHVKDPGAAACLDKAADDPCAVQIWGWDFPGVCLAGGGAEECCSSKSSTGCPSQACEDCVCGLDSFCCETQWDDICADEAWFDCDDSCFCGGGGSPDGELSCYAKPDPLSYCADKEAGAVCNYIESVDSIIGGRCMELTDLGLGSPFPDSGVGCVPPGFLEPPSGQGGGLDGVQVDECGNVYVTEYILGYIYKVSPEGEIELALKGPASWIPNMEFGRGLGGWDDQTLYMMTIGFGEDILAIETGVRGKEWTMPGIAP